MVNKLNFDEVIERVKQAAHTEHDIGAAKALGIQRSTFSERRRRGNLPYEEIIDFCDRNGLSLNWMFWGIGQPSQKEAEAATKQSVVVTGEITVRLKKEKEDGNT